MKKVKIIILLCLGISLYYAYTHVWDILEFMDKLSVKEIVLNKGINVNSRLSLSPDGKLLLFDNSKGQKIYRSKDSSPLPALETNIYILNLKDLHKQQLTDSGNRNNFYPVFSPDGTKIAFVSDRDNNRNDNDQIYIMNSDGQNVRRLTKNNFQDYAPSFSPDGSHLVFLRRIEKGKRSIILLDINSGKERELYKLDTIRCGDPWFFYSNAIFFVVNGEPFALFLSKPQSTETFYEGRLGDLLSTIYSNDRTRTAFIRGIDNKTGNPESENAVHEIFIADSKGKNAKQITHNGMYKRVKTFSPDGQSIIFLLSSDRGAYCGWELWRVDIDGSNLTKINLQ